MSRSAKVSTSKNPRQLPSKSAWARGPPQNSAITTPSRSQSPAPPTSVSATNLANFHATHSRRSSSLGQGVSIKDGVNIPRSAVKQGSAVIFGSIDDASAPISSSPVSAPAVKPADGVKSFSSVAVQNGVSGAAKSAVTNRPPPLSLAPSPSHPAPPSASTPSPVPKFDKKSIAKLFQGPHTRSIPTRPHEAASPASRTASLPSQHSQGQPYPPNFSSDALRQGQNDNPSAPPRSPVYSRPMANDQNGGVGVSRPQAGSGRTSAGPAPAPTPSPKLTSHPPPSPPSGLPPPPTMWSGYYYHPQFVPGVPPDQFYPPQWSSHLIPPQHQPPPPHHPPGAGPPSAALPMSPRNPPIPLQQVPGTPTQSRAIPPIHHPPHPSAPHPPPTVTSPPPTPSAANRPTSLSANPGAFVPGKKISIKNPSGQEVNLDALKRAPPPAVTIVPIVPPSPASVKKDIKRLIRIESQKQKERRLAEGKAREGKSKVKNRTSEIFAKANQKAEERAAREAHGVEVREKELLRLEEASFQREAEEKIQREQVVQGQLRKPREEEGAKEQRRRAKVEALRAAKGVEATRALADATSEAKPDTLPEEGAILDEADEVPQTTAAKETARVVPIESLLSGSFTRSPITPKESPRTRPTQPRARPASFLLMELGESETPNDSHQQSDDSFLRHSKYFFKDGNVTFLVDGFLYCVHRYLFSNNSLYFFTRFAQLGVRDREVLPTIVSLGDVECKDFEAFLSVLYPEDFEEHDLSYEQWKSVLHLSTRWGFDSVRKLALRSIKPPTSYDRLLLARAYAVDHWIVPALTALCERTAPLSPDEVRGMNVEDIVLVATMREDICKFGASAGETLSRVEAMQHGVLGRIASDDASLASSTSGATEHWPGSTVNATIGSDSEVRSCNGDKTRQWQTAYEWWESDRSHYETTRRESTDLDQIEMSSM